MLIDTVLPDWLDCGVLVAVGVGVGVLVGTWVAVGLGVAVAPSCTTGVEAAGKAYSKSSGISSCTKPGSVCAVLPPT